MALDSQNILILPPEKIREMVEKMERIPCPEYDGIIWPSYPSFRMKGAEKAVKDIINFDTRETDILLCTHCKSGTHWIFEIIQMLLNKTPELAKAAKANTMLDILNDTKFIDDIPSPRILDSHFQFQYLPWKHVQEGRKIFHMLRNPKDVLVSLYYHAQQDIFFNLKVPWKYFFEAWMQGKMPYGSWYDYELGMEQAEKDYPGMIYTCYYEDFKEYPEQEIKKLANFLEADSSDELIRDITTATSFENMQTYKYDSTIVFNGKGFIYRKGQVGDWINHFTVSDNERFDAQFKEKMKNSNYKFRFR